jgi:hypothetical protein
VQADRRDPRLDAIRTLSGIVKLTTRLGGAALVFSINLVNAADVIYSRPIQLGLIATWALLGLSVLLGLWTLLYTPQLVASPTLTVDAAEVRISFMLSLLSLGLGIALLAVILCVATLTGPRGESSRVVSALQAVRLSEAAVPASKRVTRVLGVELIKGANKDRFVFDTWRVQLGVASLWKRGKKHVVQAQPGVIDIFIDSDTGESFVSGQRHE